ncbi:MAG: amidohydrolase [Microbacterium sp.]|uniref:amidohydrolase n=1 Tax=Microbacterium sp. TaxID=51671 RepID=UPI001ACA83D1|nr:amidohydrolase [Microbacterium sp.]MBN9176408.1 amidohydrolase [Microbacterium sp.]
MAQTTEPGARRPFADTVFRGGAVFLGSGEPRHGHAVAVSDGRIVAVVPEHEASALIGPATTIIDLDGALLSPGFQDAHVHPVGGGVELLQCELSEATDAADTLARIRAYADAHPGEAWILGGGWSMDHFAGGAPTRRLLDEAVPDRPVLLASRDHHSSWANTAAIQAAGLDASTPDLVDGRIEREPSGFPAGTFHEGASALFDAARPVLDADLAYAGLLRAQDALVALGITGWQDALVGGDLSGVDPLDGYRRARAEGTLRVHVVASQWWHRDRGAEQIDDFIARRAEFTADPDASEPTRLDFGTVKIMVDGIAENHTAAMIGSYRDAHGHDTGEHGLSFIDAAALRDHVTALDAAGFAVHFHALGDRAVREALDAVEAARTANGPDGPRHHLAHLQVIAPEDVGRFAALDATANLQALWACHEPQLDELTLPFLQEGAEARHYPFGELHRAGARLAAGSDWPVSSADPLAAIHVAVNRVAPGSVAPPLGGVHQRLDLATAFAAYTSGSAYVNRRDGDTGRIALGYRADLVTISPDPFGLDPTEIHRARVSSTWIAGERVFAATAGALAGPQ